MSFFPASQTLQSSVVCYVLRRQGLGYLST